MWGTQGEIHSDWFLARILTKAMTFPAEYIKNCIYSLCHIMLGDHSDFYNYHDP